MVNPSFCGLGGLGGSSNKVRRVTLTSDRENSQTWAEYMAKCLSLVPPLGMGNVSVNIQAPGQDKLVCMNARLFWHEAAWHLLLPVETHSIDFWGWIRSQNALPSCDWVEITLRPNFWLLYIQVFVFQHISDLSSLGISSLWSRWREPQMKPWSCVRVAYWTDDLWRLLYTDATDAFCQAAHYAIYPYTRSP